MITKIYCYQQITLFWSINDLTYAFEGQALLGYVIVEYDNAYSVTQCSDRCMRHVPECKSYNYQGDTHSCQLNSMSDLEAPQDLRNMTGTTYYRTSAFQTHTVSLQLAHFVIFSCVLLSSSDINIIQDSLNDN